MLLGGCPIRNDPLAARSWKGYLDGYYQAGVSIGQFGDSTAEVRQKVDEAQLVWEQIAQEGEGSVAMDYNAGTVLVANFMNGNTDFLKSRVYLWNPSQSAGSVTVRAYTLPSSGPSVLLGTAELGLLDARSSLNIKIAEDVLSALGILLPYTDNGGNLTIEVTVGAENVRGAAQVFSSDLAYGTYPMQVIQ